MLWKHTSELLKDTTTLGDVHPHKDLDCHHLDQIQFGRHQLTRIPQVQYPVRDSADTLDYFSGYEIVSATDCVPSF